MARHTVLDAAACQLLLLGRSTAAAARTAASTKVLLSLLARHAATVVTCVRDFYNTPKNRLAAGLRLAPLGEALVPIWGPS